MAQTTEGAHKQAAKSLGISYEQYKLNLLNNLKHCRICKEWKYTSLFSKDRSRGDGFKTICKSCDRVPDSQRVNRRGKPSAFKGKSHSKESKSKLREAWTEDRKKKHIESRKGVPRTKETRDKISKSRRESTKVQRGENHYAFSHGKLQRKLDDRRSPKYSVWRTAVFSRDNFICQHCGFNKGRKLEAHHIKSFSENESLRFDVNNGITLCWDCHDTIHYGRPTR